MVTFECTDFYRPHMNYGEGNVFAGVCHSVHRMGCIQDATHADAHPPWDATEMNAPPLEVCTPLRKYSPLEICTTLWMHPLLWMHLPWIHPEGPPTQKTDGQQADGKHPTGLHTCYIRYFTHLSPI